MSLKTEKHEKIVMLAVSSLNTISSLMSKALKDDTISDEEYSLILLQFESFTRMKEDLRIKSKTSLEKTGNIETEASVFFNRNSSTSPTRTYVLNHVENHVKILFKTMFKTRFEKLKNIVNKKHVISKNYRSCEERLYS